MSKASKIINIFILIVAIVAVVFGTLLFQKRAQLTQARSDIANTVVIIYQVPFDNDISATSIFGFCIHAVNKTPATKRSAMKLKSFFIFYPQI